MRRIRYDESSTKSWRQRFSLSRSLPWLLLVIWLGVALGQLWGNEIILVRRGVTCFDGPSPAIWRISSWQMQSN